MAAEKDRNAVRFGREITRVRRNAGLTQTALARRIGISVSHMSNIEHGTRMPTPSIVIATDDALDEEGRLVRVYEDLTGNGRPAWLDELADLEREALSIQEFQLALFPSLLQTTDYAREVIRTTSPWAPDDEVEERLDSRMERSRRATAAPSPIMWMVVDQGVLTRTIGANDIMRTQLAHVAQLASSSRITVQVVDGQHPGLGGPFKIVSSSTAPDVVYAESPYAGQIVDSPEQVQRFRLLFGSLQAAARPPDESLRLIEERMEDLRDG